MATMSVGILSVFNHEEQEWLLYKGRLEQWFIANDINADTDKSSAKRRAILLSSLAEPTYRLVKNLALPAEVGSLEYSKLTGLLDGHFKPGKCGFAERFKFYSAVQSSGESLADWAARVRGLSLHCNFVAASLEESLRDRFVLGMAGGPERDRLFREPLDEFTLAKALQLAESIRCAREGAQQATARAAAEAAPAPLLDVHKMWARAPGPQPRASGTRQYGVPQASTSRDQKNVVQCSVCGYFNHDGKKCRFRNASCKLCGVKGHLMRVCNAKNASTNHHFVQCCSEGADDGKQVIYHIRSNRGKPMLESVMVDNIQLTFEVDTGSEVTAINESVYLEHFSKHPLRKTSIVLRSYDHSIIGQAGVILLPFTYNNQTEYLEVHVVKDGGPPLLGRDFISKFNLELTAYVKTCNLDIECDKIIANYSHLFSEKLGCCRDVEVKLHLKSDAIPVFTKARSVPFAIRPKLELELNRLLELGIIEPATSSDYASPIVPVLKPDGSIRLCADYSATLNKQLIIEKYPLPRIDELFSKLHGGLQFTKLDLPGPSSNATLYETVRQNQCSQMQYYRGSRNINFELNDLVIVKVYQGQKAFWSKALVKKQLGRSTYLVQCEHSQHLIKRHKNQMYKYRGEEDAVGQSMSEDLSTNVTRPVPREIMPAIVIRAVPVTTPSVTAAPDAPALAAEETTPVAPVTPLMSGTPGVLRQPAESNAPLLPVTLRDLAARSLTASTTTAPEQEEWTDCPEPQEPGTSESGTGNPLPLQKPEPNPVTSAGQVAAPIQLVYLTLWSLSQAAYISRMAVNRMRVPTAFRPGVTLHRPWTHPRLVQAASHRTPYVIYRNPPHRYAMKHYGPNANRNVYINGPWKTTARLPTLASVTPEYEFVKAASAPTQLRVNGAIHTIPAPNLSLSEKPIVVIDATEHGVKVTTESSNPTYEVTEKYNEPSIHVAKIESPIGFSKATSLTTPEIQTLVRNGAALQLTPEYGLSAVAMPQQAHLVPQQFTIQQGFSAMPTHQDLVQSGAEGIIIPPNALYQPDPGFLQKLQNQLLQRYPAVEFIPYAADIPTEAQIQTQASHIQPQVILLQNEITKQAPAPFIVKELQNNDKNVVQRETQENTVVTLVPQKLIITTKNVTEKPDEPTTTSQQTTQAPQNITVQVVTETHPSSTVKYIVESTTEQKTTTPLYYAQVGQSVGSAIASGFFSAINDVRAAAALADVSSETPQAPSSTDAENTTTTSTTTTTTSTTINPEFQPYFVHKKEEEKNETSGELISVLGVPFAKPEPVKSLPKAEETVKVAYTVYRAEDKDQKVAKDGSVYAGQIVEASISEDQDFNKQKNSIMSRRAPVRLVAVPAENTSSTTTSTTTLVPQKITVVKAKIPPKSKLTFDDKTGEPVLRIYASYVDTPQQKEAVVTKLTNMKQKEVIRKQDSVDNWKAATIKTVDKTQGSNVNQVTQFGLKLRSRSDDYIPLFDDYED